MSKKRIATVWLDGCSGCHMSLLDTDERLIEVAKLVDVVYSPLVDSKEFPRDVDVTLVEGAVSNEEDVHRLHLIRERSKIVVALGDCAVTGNVPAMRNSFTLESVMQRVYKDNSDAPKRIPLEVIPKLLPKARPLHDVVPVEVFVPGCPPSADTIFFLLSELLNGRVPDLSAISRFGA